jgi:GTP-binding protein Era
LRFQHCPLFLSFRSSCRFFASELIREALFETLNKELPYCCEVRIESFKEPKPGDKKVINRIKAVVVVERDSQKKIVIGKGGDQIKKVGILAREKIEKFLQEKVYLELIGKQAMVLC